jgi:hypothetical protein
MAKSDSFFIRADVALTGTTYTTTSIDLGSYVDALGKSVLRIHNVSASLQQGTAGTAPGMSPTMAGDQAGSASWQLTTQDQLGLVLASNRAVISSGAIMAGNRDAAVNPPAQAFENDMLPQVFTNGYLVAVESLQLGAQRTDDWTDATIPTWSVVLECTVETMTQASAMALALSQQGN